MSSDLCQSSSRALRARVDSKSLSKCVYSHRTRPVVEHLTRGYHCPLQNAPPRSRLLRSIRIAAALSAALLAGLSRSSAQEGSVVRSITFEGNQALSEEDLRAVMLTYETGWSGQKILGNEPYYFSREVFQNDLENLVAEYQHEGYLWARIDTAIVQTRT